MVDYCWLLKRDGHQLESITRETGDSCHLPKKRNYLLDLKTGSMKAEAQMMFNIYVKAICTGENIL